MPNNDSSGYIIICGYPRDTPSSLAMIISTLLYCTSHWIYMDHFCNRSCEWFIKKTTKKKQTKNILWDASSGHIWVWADRADFVPKVSVNVPEVHSNHVSLGGFTACRTCDVMWTGANRLPTVTHRGAQCESTTKSFGEMSCSPGCCWAWWPHFQLLLEEISWHGNHMFLLVLIYLLNLISWTKQETCSVLCVCNLFMPDF